MDPKTTMAMVDNESLPLNDRAFAALDLLVWAAKGGHITNAQIIACEVVISNELEGL